MKPVWKVVLYVAKALLSAIESVFGGKDKGSK
jgi:hypothetical protein